MDNEKIKKILKERLSAKRYKHTLGCAETAEKLAEKLGADTQKAYTAGLLHDCAKELSLTEQLAYAEKCGYKPDRLTAMSGSLLHAPVSSLMAKHEFGIDDEEILGAIAYHTTGKENMTLLEKIVFSADMVEPNRDFPGAEQLRKDIFSDFDKGLIEIFDRSISFVLEKGSILHPTGVYARNYLIEERDNAKK